MKRLTAKLVSLLLTLAMLLSLAPAALAVSAVPTAQGLNIDGKTIENVEIYSIDGTNYFRLRDLAMLLSGTGAKFSVAYDYPTNHISLATGAAYEPIGGELAAGEDRSASCVTSSQSVTVNGRPADIAHYNLGGTNFFRLRDLGASLGFEVDYDAATDTMLVSSERPDTELRLGVSNYYIQIPADYRRGAITAEQVANNMVGYYRSDKSLMDFDVYQFSKQDQPTELADYAAKEAAEYDAAAKSGTVNGLTYYYYDAVEESEGKSYPTRTYILDTGTGYTELVFWLDGDTAEEETAAILKTLQFMRSLRLGVSNYYVNIPNTYARGTVTAEEVAAGMVGYYKSEESLLDFDVYQFSKQDEPAVLADFAAKEAAEYDAQATQGLVNGIPVAFYDAEKEYDGESYSARTYILDTGTGYVQLQFWLDGESAKAEATRIINSLSGKVTLALGSSPYSITVPYDFTGGNTPSGVRVGAYQSPYSSLSFDVRQLAKDGNPAALVDFAEQEAKAHGVAPTNTAINGNPTSYYRAMVEKEGASRKELVFLLDAGTSYVELTFWLGGDTAADEAMSIIKTLDKSLVITLGKSGRSITVPNSYYEGEVTDEEKAEGLINYYKSDATLLDFDVFEISKAEQPATVAEFAAKRAAAYGVTVTDTAIKGVPVSYFRAMETYDDVLYKILTFVFDGGDNYMMLRFWLDGDTAADEAMAIIRTIQ